ncbi:tudor domain-containing protein 5 [Eucyclogobius newberryi]|uniref:tudor domain-containing protein 5 n=1 Tax=Eucyclogobius newberryi TaxID=166745 RepID=UPI003B5C440D
MDQDVVLSKLKKDVRSLLLSSKVGLEPEQLRRDYTSMLGHPMPLRQLGFRNILDMVKNMPDVASIVFRPDGTIYLSAASDETTRNLQELVSRQRTSQADRKRLQRRSGSFFSPRYIHCPNQAFVFLPRRGRAPPAVPAPLRAQLRILLSQGPVRLAQLESSFLRCFGHPLRVYSYGFYSTAEMLEAASDLLVVRQSRLGSELALRGQMLPRPLFTVSRPRAPEPPTAPVPQVPQVPQARPDVLEREPAPGLPATPGLMRALSEESSGGGSMPELIEDGRDGRDGQEEHQCFEDRVLKLEEEFRQQIQENGVAGTISQDLKDKLQQVVARFPEGVSVHDLPVEYQAAFGEELPLLESGFVSVTELVGAMTDVFHLRADGHDGDSNSWTVTGLRGEDGARTASRSEADGFKLPPTSFYFSSAASRWDGQDKGEDEDQEGEDQEEMAALEPFDELDSSTQPQETTYPSIEVHRCPIVPLDALQCQRLQPPTQRALRELVSVFVEEVDTPGNFYVRFNETEEAHAMEDMMIEMRRCYTCPEVSERYRLPRRFVRRGQACCVSPKGMWFYRVVVHQVLGPSKVRVYYVDFGAVAEVQTSQLKFLKSCYSVLPAQAVPASLAGIKPTAGLWSSEATEHFQRLCSDQTLVGALDCYSGDVLLLYLCDTHTDEDLYVHSALLQKGHGTACSPSASTKLCQRATPISLYLGDGMVELLEPEEAAAWAEQPGDAQQEDEELPELEFIENCSSPLQVRTSHTN